MKHKTAFLMLCLLTLFFQHKAKPVISGCPFVSGWQFGHGTHVAGAAAGAAMTPDGTEYLQQRAFAATYQVKNYALQRSPLVS
jgi:hypothetical protein